MSSHRPAVWFRFHSEYGLLLVLLALGSVISVATLNEQFPNDEAAARKLAGAVVAAHGPGVRVLVVAGGHAEDVAYAEALHTALTSGGAEVVGVVKGEPRDARRALVQLAKSGGRIDVIAGNHVTVSWLVFRDLDNDFPALRGARLVEPASHWWPDFLKTNNLLNIANQIAVIALIAVGMTMVIITGGIDLSVGSLIALSAVFTAYLVRNYLGGTGAGPAGVALASACGVAVCGLVGLFSGTMITTFRVPPFIVTLAVMMAASGLAYQVTRGETIDQIPPYFGRLWSGSDLLGVPNPVLLMLAVYLLAHLLMARTALGRYLYAVGGNREAARLSGIRVRRVLLFAYTASGLLAGLGGVVLTSQFKSAAASFGQTYELSVISAVVVGGTSLSGGEGKMFGTLLGAFLLGVVQNGMNLANLDPYTQRIALGLVLLAAVLLDRLKHRAVAGKGTRAE